GCTKIARLAGGVQRLRKVERERSEDQVITYRYQDILSSMRGGAFARAARIERNVGGIATVGAVGASGHSRKSPVAVEHHHAVVRRTGVRRTGATGAVISGRPAEKLRGAIINRRIVEYVHHPRRGGLGHSGPRSAQNAAS